MFSVGSTGGRWQVLVVDSKGIMHVANLKTLPLTILVENGHWKDMERPRTPKARVCHGLSTSLFVRGKVYTIYHYRIAYGMH